MPRGKGANITSTLDPFLNFMFKKLEPSMSSPNVWLFILENKDDVLDATNFASSKLDQYEYVLTTYVPSKAEMLNNITTRATAPNVPLLFLFKKSNSFADSFRDLVKTKYDTPPNCVYYLDMTKNTKAKWRIEATELRMEFYLDILRDFAKSEENVLGIYSGAKFMIAAKVRLFNLTVVILESTILIYGSKSITNHVIPCCRLISYLLFLFLRYPCLLVMVMEPFTSLKYVNFVADVWHIFLWVRGQR